MRCASLVLFRTLLLHLTLPASPAIVRQGLLSILSVVLSIYVGQFKLSLWVLLDDAMLLAARRCVLSSCRLVLFQLHGRRDRSQLLQKDVVFARLRSALILVSLLGIGVNLLCPLGDHQIVAHPRRHLLVLHRCEVVARQIRLRVSF